MRGAAGRRIRGEVRPPGRGTSRADSPRGDVGKGGWWPAGAGPGTPVGTGSSARVAAGRFSRGQRPARGVRRLDRAAWRAGSPGRHPPDGKRGPDGVALERRGLGPVVLGVGVLARAGYRRLLAPDGNTSPA